ncbi:three prime repair exonuclease 2-like [Haematobia irritans]|uniref:three prime repair exonuclease 2-like n=1 Tax=Haematobia irritans TaxID=7368 RepID=UPI003F50A622
MEDKDSIKTIAVIDLETNGLPREQNNTCAITELSLYAFPASALRDTNEDEIILHLNDDMDVIEKRALQPPQLPRVLHKMTMMINPGKEIHPVSTKMTCLSNKMLESESTFDANTANCLLMFLDRLEKPICFVAHNGWSFDYPILRYVLDTIYMTIPSSIYCIDSFKAFRELDEKKTKIDEIKYQIMDKVKGIPSSLQNETDKYLLAFNEYRKLFVQPFNPKTFFPTKGSYVLGNIYERVFQEPAGDLHRAEGDVAILSKLILHHGLVFLAYAEERKKSFAKVPKLGSK